MKRRYWWMAMFAPQAVAQQVKACVSKPATRCKPANNECPVCGTMAEEYTRQMQEDVGQDIDYEAEKKWDAENPGKTKAWMFVRPARKYPVGPRERLTRCKHCNAAFWQDAMENK